MKTWDDYKEHIRTISPEDAEDAWSIVKQLKLGTWGKQNKSIELSL